MSEATNVSQELVLYHASKIREAERKKDEAVNALRSVRKAAKVDGVSLESLDHARALLKLDEGELTGKYNELVRYAKFLSVPVYSQLDMFENPEINDETVRDRAYAAGVRAGKLGQGQNPHDPTGPAGQEWLDGYGDGQKLLLSAIETYTPPPPKGDDKKSSTTKASAKADKSVGRGARGRKGSGAPGSRPGGLNSDLPM